jgi:hypothetical protein
MQRMGKFEISLKCVQFDALFLDIIIHNIYNIDNIIYIIIFRLIIKHGSCEKFSYFT